MDVLLGLTAALSWGTAYFTAGYTTRAIGTLRTLLYTNLVGLVLLSGYLVVSGELSAQVQGAAIGAWLWMFLAAGINTLAAIADFQSIKIGPLSVVVPMTANYAVVTVAVSFLAGERLIPAQTLGIGAAVVGVVLVTRGVITRDVGNHNADINRHPLAGISWALAGALGFGLAYWIIGFFVAGSLGGVVSTWVMRLSSVGFVTLLVFRRWRQSNYVTYMSHSMLRLILLIGVLDSLATIAAFVGYRVGSVSTVTTLASMFTVVTVLLAWLIAGERVNKVQWVGVGLVVLGIVLVSQ